MSSMNVDYFRYLELAGNFLNFRLCKIQLSAQCLLGEHGPLKLAGQTAKNKIKSQAHLFFITICFLKEIVVITGKKLFSWIIGDTDPQL